MNKLTAEIVSSTKFQCILLYFQIHWLKIVKRYYGNLIVLTYLLCIATYLSSVVLL